MIFTRVRGTGNADEDSWPFTLPCVSQLATDGLNITSPFLVLWGANGSGKSTILEAIAESYGIDVRGGHAGRRYASSEPAGALGQHLQLDPMPTVPRRDRTGFFLRAETATGMLSFMSGMGIDGYGDRPSDYVSHGEGYLGAIEGRFTRPGLYLLDEAEGPLSFEATIALLNRLVQLSQLPRTQIIYASHSPLVAATPRAQIVELTDRGLQTTTWSDLPGVKQWQRFMQQPQYYFD